MSAHSDACFAAMKARGTLDDNHNSTPAAIRKTEMLKGVAFETISFDELTLDLFKEPLPVISESLRRLQAANAMARPYISFRLAAYQYPHLFINV